MKQPPAPRRPKMGNLGKALVLSALLFLLLGVAQLYFELRKRRQPPAPAALVAAGQVTLSNYAYLTPGLLYTQASEVLGGPGHELSARDSAGVHTAVYQWPGPDGAVLRVVFENDRLVRKTQTGLR